MKMNKDELMEAVRLAAGPGRTTRDSAATYLALIDDGVQAHEEWAVVERGAIERAGAAARWKALRKEAGLLPAKVGQASIEVNTTVGVPRALGWVQDEITNCNRDELRTVANNRRKARDRQSIIVRAIARLEALFDRHPNEPTLADALKAEDTDLGDVLGRSA